MQSYHITSLPQAGFNKITFSKDNKEPQAGFNIVPFSKDNKERPFLAFEIPSNEKNKSYVESIREAYTALGHATITQDLDCIKIKVEGLSAIQLAVSIFLKDADYLHSSNDVCKEALKVFIGELQEKKKNKKIEKSNASVQMVRGIQEEEHAKGKQSHKVLKMSKDDETYFLKIDERGKITEIEALAAAYYRLFMGWERAPETYSVVDDQGQRVGVISKAIEFTSAKEKYFSTKYGLSMKYSEEEEKELADCGLAEMLVASYLLEEVDLHPGNYGLNKEGKLIRIDFDLSFWPFTAKYNKGINKLLEQLSNPVNNEVVDILKEPFTINRYNIIHFPDLKEAKNIEPIESDYKWLGRSLKNNSTFIHEKWKYFLKSILLNKQSIIDDIASTYLGSENAQAKYAAHLNARLTALRNELVHMPEFVFYLEQNPKVISELIAEFQEYNTHAKEAKLEVDINGINEALQNLLSDMKIFQESMEYRSYKMMQALSQDRQSSDITSDIKIILEGLSPEKQLECIDHCFKYYILQNVNQRAGLKRITGLLFNNQLTQKQISDISLLKEIYLKLVISIMIMCDNEGRPCFDNHMKIKVVETCNHAAIVHYHNHFQFGDTNTRKILDRLFTYVYQKGDLCYQNDMVSRKK